MLFWSFVNSLKRIIYFYMWHNPLLNAIDVGGKETMDLSKPSTDYIDEIDKHLHRLEEETRLMEEQFGFKGISEAQSLVAIKKKEKAAAQPKRYNDSGTSFCNWELRFNYDNLVEVIPETKPLKPVILKPEISAEWVAANKIGPDLKVFYDKERFERQIFRAEDFVLTRDATVHLDSFDMYMINYPLIN